MRIILIITSVVVLGLTQASAQQIGACVDKSGALYGVTVDGLPNCKDKETPIFWNQVGPQGPKGDKGDPGDPGPGAVKRTLLDFDGVWDKLLLANASAEKLLTVGSFTKQETDTDVKLTFSGHGGVLQTSSWCTFQLRINGFDDNGIAAADVINATGHATLGNGSVVGADLQDAFAITTVFSADAPPFSSGTGTFDVEIWVRGVGPGGIPPTCRLNTGNYTLRVVVEETF